MVGRCVGAAVVVVLELLELLLELEELEVLEVWSDCAPPAESALSLDAEALALLASSTLVQSTQYVLNSSTMVSL